MTLFDPFTISPSSPRLDLGSFDFYGGTIFLLIRWTYTAYRQSASAELCQPLKTELDFIEPALIMYIYMYGRMSWLGVRAGKLRRGVNRRAGLSPLYIHIYVRIGVP